MTDSFLISVITINLNNFQGLKATIESVITQSFNDYQYIVIDGGSSDGSADLIDIYKEHIHYSVTEKDSGIYNAMNKGIYAALGEYCLFLNSGDYLADNNVLKNFSDSYNNSDIICGATIIRDTRKTELIKAPEILSFYDFYKHSLIHQSVFIKTTLLKKFGGYNEEMSFLSDWEFFIRVFAFDNASYKPLSFVVSSIDNEGISSSPENTKICRKERILVLNKYFSFFLADYDLISDPVKYRFLKNLNRMPLINKLFRFLFRILNKLLKCKKQQYI